LPQRLTAHPADEPGCEIDDGAGAHGFEQLFDLLGRGHFIPTHLLNDKSALHPRILRWAARFHISDKHADDRTRITERFA
jgi:hypothetical protein